MLKLDPASYCDMLDPVPGDDAENRERISAWVSLILMATGHIKSDGERSLRIEVCISLGRELQRFHRLPPEHQRHQLGGVRDLVQPFGEAALGRLDLWLSTWFPEIVEEAS